MEKIIKKISLDDLNKLAIVFNEEEVENLGLLVNDRIPIDENQFLNEVKQ